MSLVLEEFIAEKPVFAVQLPEKGFRLPNIRCVCGVAPTRNLRVTADSSTSGVNAAVNTLSVLSLLGGGGGLFLTGGSKTLSLDLPICDSHEVGATLETNRTVSFKSYRYYSQVLSLNNL